MKATILNYGGGRQTVAMCLLIVRGVLPRPDRIVMADTSREKPTTFEYLERLKLIFASTARRFTRMT